MGLFSQDQMDQINAVAEKSKEVLKPIQVSKSVSATQHEIDESTKAVLEYFGDSPAILITTVEELHEYVSKAIEAGYCAIDTETTGKDVVHDTIVGCSLYYPGGVECYIPNKHLVPIFNTPYKNQLTYEQVGYELRRFVITDTKMIFANAGFDLAVIYKDYKVDLIPVFYYDVIHAWRCIKEDEKKNGLKELYAKYPMKGKVDPKKFSDFFSPKLFPFCRPDVAKLYAAYDAKITYGLFLWQLPYVTKSHPKCQKHKLERIADLVWNIEMPMVKVCALMHRYGIYFDADTSNVLKPRYHIKYDKEFGILANMVDEIMATGDIITRNRCPFKRGLDFNPSGSSPHTKYLLEKFLGIQVDGTDKEALTKINLPITAQILKVRSFGVLINSFVDKLPSVTGADGRIHSTFNSVGASTGRFCIAKGTKITCLNGEKNIEDIVPGDLVKCVDEHNEVVVRAVKNLWLTGTNRDCVKIIWRGYRCKKVKELICTPEHQILTFGHFWKQAKDLTSKDTIFWNHKNPMYHSVYAKVILVEPAGKYDVYDIEVEDIHNFIANEICVHNSSKDPNVQNIPSHALDIRHQFRATPAMEKTSDCEETDEGIVVTLGSYDTVYMADGTEKDVIDLRVGDTIILLNNGKEVQGIVKSISDQAPNTCLCLNV